MDKTILLLLIREGSTDGEYLRQALTGGEGRMRVQPVDSVGTGLARIAGGGVDAVILDLSRSQRPEIEMLDSLLKLHAKAPQVPLIVVGDSEEDSVIVRAVRAGAADYVTRARCEIDLKPLVQSALGRVAPIEARAHSSPQSRKAGAILAFLGAKGGVGTTTVALNVACGLTQWGRVILAELRPMFGTLSAYFHPRGLAGNITTLLEGNAGTIASAKIEACLWPVKGVPGLSILFGPQTIEQCHEAEPQSAQAVLQALSLLADYVVIDLPPYLSLANRAVLQKAGSLVLVVEREPLCVESAKLILETIRGWDALPADNGAVVVNRSPLVAAPLDLSDIDKQLAIPTLGVIPPAVDLCLMAQRAGKPLVVLDADSLAGQSLLSLAGALRRQDESRVDFPRLRRTPAERPAEFIQSAR